MQSDSQVLKRFAREDYFFKYMSTVPLISEQTLYHLNYHRG